MWIHPVRVKKNAQTYISPKLCLMPEIKSKYFRTGECVGIGQTTVAFFISYDLRLTLQQERHRDHRRSVCFKLRRLNVITQVYARTSFPYHLYRLLASSVEQSQPVLSLPAPFGVSVLQETTSGSCERIHNRLGLQVSPALCIAPFLMDQIPVVIHALLNVYPYIHNQFLAT